MASLAINSILRNFAKEKKLLVDIPDRSRKFHKRATPLTGGIGILLAVIISTEIYLDMNNLKGYMPEFSQKLYIASIPLLLVFLIDDVKSLPPLYRLFIQIVLSLYVIFSTDIYFKSWKFVWLWRNLFRYFWYTIHYFLRRGNNECI